MLKKTLPKIPQPQMRLDPYPRRGVVYRLLSKALDAISNLLASFEARFRNAPQAGDCMSLDGESKPGTQCRKWRFWIFQTLYPETYQRKTIGDVLRKWKKFLCYVSLLIFQFFLPWSSKPGPKTLLCWKKISRNLNLFMTNISEYYVYHQWHKIP